MTLKQNVFLADFLDLGVWRWRDFFFFSLSLLEHRSSHRSEKERENKIQFFHELHETGIRFTALYPGT